MTITINNTEISLVIGDITRTDTEVIVNAANSGLRGGGGVDGAIHRAGGPVIMEECRKIGSCPTGNAVVTSAGNLPVRYIIHAVGPIYRGGNQGEDEALRSAYHESMERATENDVASVSFPAISAGVYGYPLDEAARIAVETVRDYLKEHSGMERVQFVLFDQRTFDAFNRALESLDV